jgi:hypothetical protein
MIKFEQGWASVSVDMLKCTTHLVHPAVSGTPHSDVLDFFRPTMEKLTSFAVSHIKHLTNRRIPDIQWVYDVALKKQHIMHGYTA